MWEIEVAQYGVFNSKNAYAGLTYSPKRRVLHFEFDFILSCERGAACHVDEKAYPLHPNMLVLRKPNQTSNSRLHFSCSCLHLCVPEGHILYGELTSLPDCLTAINAAAYQKLFEDLMRHLIKSDEKSADMFVLAKVLELAYRIQSDAKKTEPFARRGVGRESACVKQAVAYVKAHFSSKITLEDLGRAAGYSPNHFQRVFKSFCGVSPQEYLEKTRVDYAKQLLLQGQRTMTEIAYACGFSSQPHFCKTFKKHTFLTPSQFQQKARFSYAEDGWDTIERGETVEAKDA